MSRGRGPRRIYHRGGRRGRFSVFDWIRIIGTVAVLCAFVGYLVWIYVLHPAAPHVHGHTHVWLPLVRR